MKKILSIVLSFFALGTLLGCGENKEIARQNQHLISLMTDTGGINDQAFNQSAWEGAQKVEKELGFKIKYVESKQVADYKTNIDTLTDDNPDMIFVMGYTAADTLKEMAKIDSDQHYTIIDYKYDEPINNVLSVSFRDQEPAFLVGYIAANMTKTNKVGFIGGMKSDTIDAFEYGYRAGVFYASKELKKTIDVKVQYAENFQDDTKGKAMANVMYSNGIDIIYHAAGNLGRGVIEAAKDNKKYAIGADRDQQYLAPENVISSTLKLTGAVVYEVCNDIFNKDNIDEITGKNKTVGLKEEAVGISQGTKNIIGDALMKKVEEIKSDIIEGKIIPPNNEKLFKNYVK